MTGRIASARFALCSHDINVTGDDTMFMSIISYKDTTMAQQSGSVRSGARRNQEVAASTHVDKASDKPTARTGVQATAAEKQAADKRTQRENKPEPNAVSIEQAAKWVADGLEALAAPVLAITAGIRNGWQQITKTDHDLDTRGAACYGLVRIAAQAADAAVSAARTDADRAVIVYAGMFERHAPSLMLTVYEGESKDDAGEEIHPRDWQEVVTAVMEQSAVEGFDDQEAMPQMRNALRAAITRAANTFSARRNKTKVSPSGMAAGARRGTAGGKTPRAVIAVGNNRRTLGNPASTGKTPEQIIADDAMAVFATIRAQYKLEGVQLFIDALVALLNEARKQEEMASKAA